LSSSELHDLYFTLLLKDAGCSSNAARICELYATDDLTAYFGAFRSVISAVFQASCRHFYIFTTS
ncbi:hypothetical protein KW475_21945, partial [Vibrio fluvialis]|nr:hypothetical protein [Vibrio fluvialis]